MADAELKKPIRIAIVEDDPALRKMIVSLLQADPRYGAVAEFAEDDPRFGPRPSARQGCPTPDT